MKNSQQPLKAVKYLLKANPKKYQWDKRDGYALLVDTTTKKDIYETPVNDLTSIAYSHYCYKPIFVMSLKKNMLNNHKNQKES